jgi:zinc transporter ZupT
MIATSFFGLLQPSIEESIATYDQTISWIPPLVGFILVVALAFKNYEVMENEVQDEIQKSENNDRWN